MAKQTMIANELRTAAERIRHFAELVAKLLDEEADDMDRTANESIYGENAVRFVYDVGDVAPILQLARAINAEPASRPPAAEGSGTPEADHE